MKTIQVSTDVFAEIWKIRREGEESENDILARILGCERKPIGKDLAVALANVVNPRIEHPQGFSDFRNNVKFPEGFQIHRNYKNKKYTAIATMGKWKRQDTGQYFESLNQLNESIASGNENVWNGNWKFIDGEIEHSIDELRKK